MFDVEYRIRRRDERWICLRDRAFATYEKNGVMYADGIFSDITEHKKAEEEIRKLSSAVEQSIDGIAISDLEPRLLYVNDAYARMHGYSPEEMIGMAVTKLHNAEQISDYKKDINQIKTQGSWEGEIGHIRKDGTPFPTYMSVTLLRNNKGKPTGILAVTRDITEFKQIERREREHQAALAHYARLNTVGEMAFALAHELNQPLCAIASSAKAALRMMKSGDWDSNELLEAMEEAGAQAERAGNIIHRTTKLVRKKEPPRSSVNIENIIDEASALIEHEAQLEGITIQLVEPSEKLPMLEADAIQIEQVLLNLIRNSFDAMEDVNKSKKQVTIEVSVDKDDTVQVAISDTGHGLPAENIDRIFEHFFTTKSKGLGMGLSISRSIIEAHGGRIWAEHNPAGGATFRFTLPAGRRIS